MPNYYGQPYTYFPQVYQPQTPPPMQQPVQSSIIWISGPQEAQMYPITPNNAVALWEKTGKTIYLKQADATVKPTITVYDLVERAQTATDGLSADGGKLPVYATKDELGAIVGTVRGIDEVIAGLKADIETMKGDMYGMAGRKKKKPEVAEGD